MGSQVRNLEMALLKEKEWEMWSQLDASLNSKIEDINIWRADLKINTYMCDRVFIHCLMMAEYQQITLTMSIRPPLIENGTEDKPKQLGILCL